MKSIRPFRFARARREMFGRRPGSVSAKALEEYRKFYELSIGKRGPTTSWIRLSRSSPYKHWPRRATQYLAAVIEYNRAQFQLFTAMGRPAAESLPKATPTPVTVPTIPPPYQAQVMVYVTSHGTYRSFRSYRSHDQPLRHFFQIACQHYRRLRQYNEEQRRRQRQRREPPREVLKLPTLETSVHRILLGLTVGLLVVAVPGAAQAERGGGGRGGSGGHAAPAGRGGSGGRVAPGISGGRGGSTYNRPGSVGPGYSRGYYNPGYYGRSYYFGGYYGGVGIYLGDPYYYGSGYYGSPDIYTPPVGPADYPPSYQRPMPPPADDPSGPNGTAGHYCQHSRDVAQRRRQVACGRQCDYQHGHNPSSGDSGIEARRDLPL